MFQRQNFNSQITFPNYIPKLHSEHSDEVSNHKNLPCFVEQPVFDDDHPVPNQLLPPRHHLEAGSTRLTQTLHFGTLAKHEPFWTNRERGVEHWQIKSSNQRQIGTRYSLMNNRKGRSVWVRWFLSCTALNCDYNSKPWNTLWICHWSLSRSDLSE